tara:strand:- start:921 stop:1679 length:759 start_codon:yes stop_codon:yes gene_type:complete
MAGIRDIDSGKIYIGPEDPKVDQSTDTLDGDKEFDGTLAAVGPVFLGEHSDSAFGHVNIGTDIGLQKFVPQMKGRALDIEGDVNIVGNGSGFQGVNSLVIDGDVYVTGAVDCLSKGRLEARHATADSLPKPFDMVHPSKGAGHRLRYACIEGPEVGVYFRGRTESNEIPLPDYWKDLVLIESITVQTQPIGSKQEILVHDIDDEKIILEGVTDCFFHVYGERKDVNPLVVEYEGETWEDYPDPEYNDSAFAR